jgi:hypothetical protein
MTDTEFARAVERGAVPADDFSHRSHLRLAWVYLAESPSTEAATIRMAGELRKFTERVGKPEKYSDSITRFWMEKLAAARASMPQASFDDLLRAHPELLSSKLAEGADR